MQGAGEIDDQVRQSTDAELVGKTLDGDPTAYAELVARHQNSVFALLSSRLRDRSALEDFAQEALLEAYTHLRSLGTRSVSVLVGGDHNQRRQSLAAYGSIRDAEDGCRHG